MIISNNCWGAELYKRLGLQYNTPFVGLFIFGPDYLQLLSKLDYYLDQPLSFLKESRWMEDQSDYPIGNLAGIEIHFVHYQDEKEALEKWTRRVDRLKKVVDRDRFFLKICDRDQVNTELIAQFHALPYKHKVSFGIKDAKQAHHYKIEEHDHHQTVPDGVVLYRFSFKYIDLLKWLSSGKVATNSYNKIKAIIGVA